MEALPVAIPTADGRHPQGPQNKDTKELLGWFKATSPQVNSNKHGGRKAREDPGRLALTSAWRAPCTGGSRLPRQGPASCRLRRGPVALTKSCWMSVKSFPYFSRASSKRLASEADHSSISSRQSTGPPCGTRAEMALATSYTLLCSVSMAWNCGRKRGVTGPPGQVWAPARPAAPHGRQGESRAPGRLRERTGCPDQARRQSPWEEPLQVRRGWAHPGPCPGAAPSKRIPQRVVTTLFFTTPPRPGLVHWDPRQKACGQ